jgi:hypothetical protein
MNARILSARKVIAGLTLAAGSVVAGGAIASATTANAATPAPAASSSSAAAAAPSTGNGSAETALTGTTLAKVKAAVAAKYPGATFDRVTTDSDGVYEADITTKAGAKATVEVNAAFAVTGLETRSAGGHGGASGASGTATTSTAPTATA